MLQTLSLPSTCIEPTIDAVAIEGIAHAGSIQEKSSATHRTHTQRVLNSLMVYLYFFQTGIRFNCLYLFFINLLSSLEALHIN